MNIYHLLVLIFWGVFVLWWVVSAYGAKKVVSRVNSRGFLWGTLVIIAVFMFVPKHYRHYPILPHTPEVLSIGTALCGLAIAFAIWARVHIGSNWSGRPSVQEGHQLVTSGPYRFVRHPIYTGILLGMFGTFFVNGLLGLVIFLYSSIIVLWRIKTEEQIMLQLFPDAYPEYKMNTRALIPFIW